MPKITQAGAIPYRWFNGSLQFLLVTSQRGNWIFPKGIVEPGDTQVQTAEKECREEAGVNGRAGGEAIGIYSHRKWMRECEVHMYLLKYEGDVHPWEESTIRQRRWCNYEEACRLIKRSDLRKLLDLAHDRLLTNGEPGRRAEVRQEEHE